MEISPAEAQLILFSASVAARRRDRRDQAQRLICEVDWRRLTETLRLRRLLPTLGPHILELTELHADAGFSTAVEEAIATARRHATFLQLTSLRVMSALLDADIRCAPLKGPFLAEAIYGDAGRRLSSDIDLLVAPEQLRAATDIVRGLGYEAPADPVDASGLPQLHFLLIHKERALPPVELHWRVHSYERCFARELLLPPAGSRPGDWRPAPADELIALLLFYARDGFIDLRLASDVSGWWDRRGAELRRGAVEERLRTYPALARVVRASARAAEKVVGLPATRVFQDVPVLAARERVAVRLANPNPHASSSQLYADMGLVDGLLSPPGGLGAFIRRRVLPSREFLDELDRRAPKRRARSSLGRGAGILGRYALRIAQAAFAPERMLR